MEWKRKTRRTHADTGMFRYLKVRDIVVCGHTSCGGVNATLGNSKLGVLDIWLQPMRALREKHSEELEKLEVRHDPSP